ncbi:MAG: endonuclease [Roseibium sp.]|uniref:endonuclease n=1 Tax=Roseibium sp. TaxID=1936156 RepID=UPI001B152D31|nr:endonuclease [Roseibium sp.]MBO6510036.1 endonuclease [Roseibium sp.]MBO6892876.1 endonuclease [Roseibium sp.]MBO6927977.1 endonuclease [Roseibium sp.]
MIVFTYAVIAIAFVVLGIGGIMYLDHRFSQSVGDRPFAMKGRRIETDDPFVRRQFKKFYALRVAWSLGLLVLLFVVVSHVG